MINILIKKYNNLHILVKVFLWVLLLFFIEITAHELLHFIPALFFGLNPTISLNFLSVPAGQVSLNFSATYEYLLVGLFPYLISLIILIILYFKFDKYPFFSLALAFIIYVGDFGMNFYQFLFHKIGDFYNIMLVSLLLNISEYLIVLFLLLFALFSFFSFLIFKKFIENIKKGM